MTVMDNLHRKGLLSREMDGRAYQYLPTRTRTDHSAELIAGVLADADDRTAPLLRFVDQMSPAEVARLRASLDAATRAPDESSMSKSAGKGHRRPGRP